jgi:hypothetical protein
VRFGALPKKNNFRVFVFFEFSPETSKEHGSTCVALRKSSPRLLALIGSIFLGWKPSGSETPAWKAWTG